MLSTFVKVLVFLIGFGFVFWNLGKGLIKGTPGWQTKTLKYFFLTAGAVIGIILLDYVIVYFVKP